MTLYKWSQTATADANADSTINWAEGQSPSSVNDSARAMMAATAKYRDDIAGAIVTGGTSTAYTVSSYEVFDTLVRLNGQMIAFTPHVTNGATVTLSVDGLGAKPLQSAPGVELLAGTLIQGTPYVALYNHASAAFHLHGLFGNPYNVPLGGAMVYFGATAPNNSFVFPYGQTISRFAYAALFTLFGTTYGAGDGSTTFHIPDLRGRVPAGKDDMGGAAPIPPRLTAAHFGAITGAVGTTLGAVGGSESHALTTAQLASHTHTGTTGTESATHTHGYNQPSSFGASGAAAGIFGTSAPGTTGPESATHTHNFTSDASGGGAAHNNAQPTIVCNYILRVL